MAPLLLLAPILVAVAYFDVRFMRIPNGFAVVALVLFVLTVPLIGWEEGQRRLFAAAVVFALGVCVYLLRLIGAGDVKMIAALVLFVPSQSYVIFGATFAAVLLLGILFFVVLRQTPKIQALDLASMKEPGTFPMGVAIAGSGLSLPLLLAALN